MKTFILAIVLWMCPLAYAAPAVFLDHSTLPDEESMQSQVNSVISEIMSTKVGQALCYHVLGADHAVIQHHLGVSPDVAKKIAQSCADGAPFVPWISPTPSDKIRKLSVTEGKRRKYRFILQDSIPFDSWTEPYSNTTVFVIHSTRKKPINRQRLLQLMAHETAVYFDPKVVVGHDDITKIPELKKFRVISKDKTCDPKVSAMNPVIAHTLTFIRAMQVEGAITLELAQRPYSNFRIPEDYKNPRLKKIIGGQCGEDCIDELVNEMSEIYLPLSLPMVTMAPFYRGKKREQIKKLELSKTDPKKWRALEYALNILPSSYQSFTEGTSEMPFMDLIQYFVSVPDFNFKETESTFREVLWPEDWECVKSAVVPLARYRSSLLKFMGTPLLSGYNIQMSNGPRVRIRAGDSI